jgi:D-tyrosyl-tRNA(Tyr) deacylase
MASEPNLAKTQYHTFHKILENEIKKPVPTGVFGADMKVSLTNDGPVTIIIDSKNKS